MSFGIMGEKPPKKVVPREAPKSVTELMDIVAAIVFCADRNGELRQLYMQVRQALEAINTSVAMAEATYLYGVFSLSHLSLRLWLEEVHKRLILVAQAEEHKID